MLSRARDRPPPPPARRAPVVRGSSSGTRRAPAASAEHAQRRVRIPSRTLLEFPSRVFIIFFFRFFFNFPIMVKTKDNGGVKSNAIVAEVECRPCLYDSNHPHYGERAAKARCWEEVCERVVPHWSAMDPQERFSAGKEIQKRWRSIRDSYTKAFRQGKCVLPEHCPSTSRRYQYHRQMSFLLRALQNKKPRASQDKYESFSEVSNSPQHPPPDDFVPRIKSEPVADQKPLDLKTRPDTPDKTETKTAPTVDKANQVTIEDIELNHGVDMRNPSLEIKIDANSILPDDHFNDDKLFMNSLLPLFKKMDDDTRLLCRIEVLKIIRYALQGHKCFEALKIAEDSFFKTRISGILAKEENESSVNTTNGSTLSMTTRSADGSRPIRKRRLRSPSPLPPPPKRRGPGRPRKVRPPPSDSEEDEPRKRRQAPVPIVPANLEPRLSELDEELSRATSVAQLETPLFMKMYNLERTKKQTSQNTQCVTQMQASVKTEPLDVMEAAA